MTWHKNIHLHGKMFGPLKVNTHNNKYVQDELIFVLSKFKHMYKKDKNIYIQLLTDIKY